MPDTTVFVRTRFTGFHRWPEAPDEVAFLRNLHRHEFWLCVGVRVDHSDRDVEFFILKREVDAYLEATEFPERSSCEQMANSVGEYLRADGYAVAFVTVEEDGENGARVAWPE